MIEKFLVVSSIEPLKEGKNGKYFNVYFTPKYMLKDGTPVATAIKDCNRVVFGESHLEDGTLVKEDSLFRQIMNGTVQVGTLIDGRIERVNTTPYRIEGSMTVANAITGVIFGHESSTDVFNRKLKKVGACVVDQYGTATAREQIRDLSVVSANVYEKTASVQNILDKV